MNSRKKEASEHFRQLTNAIDRSYESWATKNREFFPELFTDNVNDGNCLCPVHQQAARYYISVLLYCSQNIWSYAGDIVGGEINEDSPKSNDNFLHLSGMTFIPAEVARHSVTATRLLTYQAVAHEYASDSSTESITDEEFAKALLNMTSSELSMYPSLMQHLTTELGVNCLPIPDVYVPLSIRHEVFKRLMSNLFAKFEDIASADAGLKLMSEALQSVSMMTSNFAFSAMARQSPCSLPGCALHKYHFEHTAEFV